MTEVLAWLNYIAEVYNTSSTYQCDLNRRIQKRQLRILQFLLMT